MTDWGGELLIPNCLEGEGDNIPRGFRLVWHVSMAKLSFYDFLRAEIPKFAEVECSGKGGMRVINHLNCALVLAFRQIPPPYGVSSSLACQHIIVTTCWEAHPSSHLQRGN